MSTVPLNWSLSSCGKTSEYLKQYPEVSNEIIQAVKKHIEAHPEIQAQLDRQQEALDEIRARFKKGSDAQ